jgi:hypothetical protein
MEALGEPLGIRLKIKMQDTHLSALDKKIVWGLNFNLVCVLKF